MTDTVLLVKDATEAQKKIKVSDFGIEGLIPYHLEEPAQRAELVAILNNMLSQLNDENLLMQVQIDQQTSIINALAGTLKISATGLPLPTGAATNAKLDEIKTIVADNKNVGIAGALPLPNGAATELTVQAIATALAGVLNVAVQNLPLPAGASTAAKQAEILAALVGTVFPVSVATLPLPAGAATEAKVEEVRALQAALNTLVTNLSAKLPASLGAKTGAASLSVAPATDATFKTDSVQREAVSKSGTITTGGTAQVIFAIGEAANGFWIQNQSDDDLYFRNRGSGGGNNAGPDQNSLKIGPGQYYEAPTGTAYAGSIYGATTGQAFNVGVY